MKNTIMIVFGDGRHGHNLACQMCAYNDEHSCFEQILVVIDKSFEKQMSDIKCKSCKIIPVDFNKHKKGDQMQIDMSRGMSEHNPDWMVLLPTGDTCTPDAMKCSMECYKEKGGKNVVLCSRSHIEEATEEPVCHVKEIEKLMCSLFPRSCMVLCVQMIMMELDYFIEDVKQKKAWRLPLEDGKFSPFTLVDKCMAVGKICMEKEIRPEWAGKKFTLTNTDKLDGHRLAELTGTALNVDTKFENIKLEEACKVLEKYIWHNASGVDAADKKGCMHRKLTSKMEACGLLFAFKMIMAHKYDCVTDDFKKITGTAPMSIEDYLRKNQDRFKGSN